MVVRAGCGRAHCGAHGCADTGYADSYAAATTADSDGRHGRSIVCAGYGDSKTDEHGIPFFHAFRDNPPQRHVFAPNRNSHIATHGYAGSCHIAPCRRRAHGRRPAPLRGS